jgi:hypothetical protein
VAALRRPHRTHRVRRLAGDHPEKVAELAAAWEEAAWRNTVFPLLDRGDLTVRRPGEDALTAPVRLIAGTPVLERYRSSRLIHFRCFTIDVELGGYRPGEEGVLVAHGDPFGGYLLVVEDGLLHVVVNSAGRIGSAAGPLPAGTTGIRLDVRATADLRWHLTATAGGVPVAKLDDQVALTGMAPWTGISVGVDARGPVSWALRRRRGPFRFTGTLRAVTYTPGEITVPEPVVRAVTAAAEAESD